METDPRVTSDLSIGYSHDIDRVDGTRHCYFDISSACQKTTVAGQLLCCVSLQAWLASSFPCTCQHGHARKHGKQGQLQLDMKGPCAAHGTYME